MNHLVKLTSFENQKVLDPFMWSWSTWLACLDLKRKFIWYELDENYFKIAERRFINKEKKQSLF
jgi:DNA modification methylase